MMIDVIAQVCLLAVIGGLLYLQRYAMKMWISYHTAYFDLWDHLIDHNIAGAEEATRILHTYFDDKMKPRLSLLQLEALRKKRMSRNEHKLRLISKHLNERV